MNLPNKISLARTILIPIFVICLLVNFTGTTISILGGHPIHIHQLIGAIIFIIASITDYVDGYIARKYNLITNMGKFLDPLADKLLVSTALIVMVELQMLPAWMVIIIISREFIVTGLRLLAVEQGEVIAAGWLGKLKTTFQMIGMSLLLLGNPIFNIFDINLGMLVMWLAVVLTIISGIEYVWNSRYLFKN